MEASSSPAILHGVFFEKFISITHYQTMIGVLAILFSFFILKRMQDKKVSFSFRMLAALVIGAVLGLAVQASAGFPSEGSAWMKEIGIWYGLPGRAFVAFIRMLVIPLIFVSIIKVIIDLSGKQNLAKITSHGVFWLLFTTGIACVIGIGLANLFGLGVGATPVSSPEKAKVYTNLVETILRLIPNNIVSAMNGENIVGVVIFSALIGIGANRMEAKHPDAIGVFKQLVAALYNIVMSVAMTIIKYMPYAVVALLARTIVTNGIPAILQVSSFVVAIYVATALMLLVHLVIVALHGVSPVLFVRKALGTWLMAFTSRSSMATLPVTISTLTGRMGVNGGTANLVGSLGSTMGMNGCAGFFPAMIAIMVAHMVGIEVNIQFYLMLVVVVVIGSIGVAGIPGTATVAATIVLSGMGMGEHFPLIGMILAIDPIIDMGRTLANVSGTMVSAIATDRELGTMDMAVFNDNDVGQETQIAV